MLPSLLWKPLMESSRETQRGTGGHCWLSLCCCRTEHCSVVLFVPCLLFSSGSPVPIACAPLPGSEWAASGRLLLQGTAPGWQEWFVTGPAGGADGGSGTALFPVRYFACICSVSLRTEDWGRRRRSVRLVSRPLVPGRSCLCLGRRAFVSGSAVFSQSQGVKEWLWAAWSSLQEAQAGVARPQHRLTRGCWCSNCV